MLKYKINIADALERKGFNTYKAKTTKLLSQETLKKIKKEDTNISLESINRICMILDMQPKDLVEYVENEEEKKKYGDSEYDARIFFVELHLRKKTDLSFPINVSAFRVLNHGDSLISLNDELKFKGIPISSKAVHDAHYWYDAMSRKNLLYKPTNFQDTLYWHATLNRQNANYTIKDINNTMVRVSKGAIAFNILNPRYYPQSEALPYAQRREYCEWFDRVNVGDTISLELTRAAYEQEVFDRSPYLKGYPDTIYVLDNEAYGYWFAKPIYNNR